MSTSTPSSPNEIRPRKPLNSQKNVGGDMSMMFFVRCQCPRRFATVEQQQVKSLNFETIAEIPFPPPTWITNPPYNDLRADLKDDDSHDTDMKSFSLNFSMYNQTLTPSDWNDTWFFMYGRVHPYALSWEVEPENDEETSIVPQYYTIPALIVRDQGYQP